MTDRELLELAAKAAGIEPILCYESNRNCLRIGDRISYSLWRPLTDDGDALRLAVKLGLIVEAGSCRTIVFYPGADESVTKPIEWYEGSDSYAATRRAIVRAAAAIGERL